MPLFPFRMICIHRQKVNKLCLISPQTQARSLSAYLPPGSVLECTDIRSVSLQINMRDKDVCTTGILFAGTREFDNLVLRRIYLPVEEISLEEIT